MRIYDHVLVCTVTGGNGISNVTHAKAINMYYVKSATMSNCMP